MLITRCVDLQRWQRRHAREKRGERDYYTRAKMKNEQTATECEKSGDYTYIYNT